MLSLCYSTAHTTTIAMNRGEQESLFRQSHDIRLQQDEKAHNERIRHYSYGNIHQVTNLHSQASNSRSFGEDRPFGAAHCDDLVLSVLKTPLRTGEPEHQQLQQRHHRTGTASTLGTPSPSSQSCAYTALQGSEDELVDDIESAKELFELQHERLATSPRAFQFLRRFRSGAAPTRQSQPPHSLAAPLQPLQPAGAATGGVAAARFEGHHRRVPTPMRRKSRPRTKSQADILDGVQSVHHGRHGRRWTRPSKGVRSLIPSSRVTDDDDEMDEHDVDDPADSVVIVGSSAGIGTGIGTGAGGSGSGNGGGIGGSGGTGIPDPYYPIALPIDTAFKAKYVFHHRRGKTFQERMYVFLEHPGGWLCFIYHFSV